MKTELQAEEILNYCISWLSNFDNLQTKEFQKSKRYKEMLNEIVFMIDTN